MRKLLIAAVQRGNRALYFSRSARQGPDALQACPTMQMVATNATYLAARASAPATIQIRLDNSLGAILIGLIFASM